MEITDISDLGSKLLVKIPNNKTNKPRSFIVNETYLEYYRKYIASRPKDFNSLRFFFKYTNGKGFKQAVGIHQFGKMPQIVATFLKLPDAKQYTGHCFRRSSATILVDNGADLTCLKRFGGWKSSTVAEGYIDESIINKIEVAHKIFDITDNETADANNVNDFNSNISTTMLGCDTTNPPMFNNCTNCTITVNITNK